MSVGKVLRRSAFNYPDKTAIIFGDQRITYAELDRRVNRLANNFLEMGLNKGDRVAILLHNCPAYIELYFACAKSGGIVVPVNNLLRKKELVQIFQYLEPRFLVFDKDFEEVVRETTSEVKCIEHAIELHGELEDFKPYDDLIERGNAAEPDVTVSDDDIGSIFLTSGTTGRPKGAMRTHRHDVLNMMTSALEIGLTHDDRTLFVFPLYHITYADNLRHILMANTIVIKREGAFDPEAVLETVSNEGITACQLVPTMVSALLQVENPERYDLSSFKKLMYAGSPMPVELLKKALTTFDCQFYQLYGQTETGPCTTALRPEDHVLEGDEAHLRRLASAGRPVVDYELRIVDKHGNDVGIGEVGEITVRSDAMTVGYWNLPEETEKTIRDGWLYTGDFGKFDEDKYVFIVDRKNDMIISGGKNIYPREIEEVLYTHSSVLEAAVIGVPDDHWGESVKALVVLKEGMETTEEEIISMCRQTLASYKKPKSVEFVPELPKSPIGKILKRLIRQQYWHGRERRV